MNIKIYENYGVLSAEKRRVYTFGGPHTRAATAAEMYVEIPEGWGYWENNAGCGMVTAPWGTTYGVSEVLCGDEFPHFMRWITTVSRAKQCLGSSSVHSDGGTK